MVEELAPSGCHTIPNCLRWDPSASHPVYIHIRARAMPLWYNAVEQGALLRNACCALYILYGADFYGGHAFDDPFLGPGNSLYPQAVYRRGTAI